MENVFVREVKKDDLKRVWKIRTHPAVRAMSGNPEKISFEQHEPWFKRKYFSDQDNSCYILENARGIVIGYCRFDFDSDHNQYVISIALDPLYHGKGLGQHLLNESLASISKGKKIFAEIKKGNKVSLCLFQKYNFTIIKEDKKNYYLIYEK